MQIRSQPKGALDLEPEHCGDLGGQSVRLGQQEDIIDASASVRREELQRSVTVGCGESGGLLQPPSDRVELRSGLGGCGGSGIACTPHGALRRALLHRLLREGEARDLRLVG